MCPSAMLGGGVALLPVAARQGDTAQSPWLLTVSGVVLDSVSSVTLLFTDGSRSATAEVHNNVFQVSVSGHSTVDIAGYTANGQTYSVR